MASPAIVPKTFPDEFYLELVENGNRLESVLRNTPVKPAQTIVASLIDLTAPQRAMAIASIMSKFALKTVYSSLLATLTRGVNLQIRRN